MVRLRFSGTGLDAVPLTVPRRLGGILREPVLLGAVGGLALSWWWLRDRVRPAIVAGVLLVTVADVAHSDTSAGAARLALVLGPLALLALAPFALRGRGVPSWTMVVGAGLAFAIGAFALKLIADAVGAGDWLALLAAGAVAGAMALIGVNGEMSALQVRPVAAVAPVIFAIELTVPVVLGPVVGGESWPTDPPRLAALLGGLVVTVSGAIAVMRSRSVVAVLEAEHAGAFTWQYQEEGPQTWRVRIGKA